VHKGPSKGEPKVNLQIDPDLKGVLEFMQNNIPAQRLVSTAARIPEMAGLLWGCYPQEPCRPLYFELPKLVGENRSLSNATESLPAPACVGGDSAGEVDEK
jgi:hypothetical protein